MIERHNVFVGDDGIPGSIVFPNYNWFLGIDRGEHARRVGRMAIWRGALFHWVHIPINKRLAEVLTCKKPRECIIQL